MFFFCRGRCTIARIGEFGPEFGVLGALGFRLRFSGRSGTIPSKAKALVVNTASTRMPMWFGREGRFLHPPETAENRKAKNKSRRSPYTLKPLTRKPFKP